MSIAEALLTAEEFARIDNDGPAELVRGRIEFMNPPRPLHGLVCGMAAHLLISFVKVNDLGRVMSNDSGIITQRDPDTVRGADIAFYSYLRVPKGPLPEGYLAVVPELVVEVLSPEDRWPRVLRKIGEYLESGVLVVCILDPKHETAQVFRADQPADIQSGEDVLEFPEALPGFRVRVKEFFE